MDTPIKLANGQVSIDRLAQVFVRHVPDAEYCEDCFAVFIWDEIPDEFVKVVHEYRGECHGAPAYEPTVQGWTCPVCGHYQSM